MHIDDKGLLVNDLGDLINVSHKPGKHRNKKIDVTTMINHYAVTHNLDSTVAAQRYRGYFAHNSIDGYNEGKRSVMKLIQTVPFGIQGSHAKGHNHYSFGVEIANPGPLIEEAGVLKTTYNKRWDKSDAIETGPVDGYPKNWTWWAKYADEEMAILASVALAMKERKDLFPNFEHITGHHDVDPKRKFDPGPIFPMEWLKNIVFPAS